MHSHGVCWADISLITWTLVEFKLLPHLGLREKKYSKKKRNPHYVLILVSCTHQHTFSLTSIFGMLSHYSSESQLRELLRLAPPIGISQTMDDLGFSWGYLSWGGGADHNLHDHVVQMFIQEDDLK